MSASAPFLLLERSSAQKIKVFTTALGEREKKVQLHLLELADYAFSTSNCQHLFNYFTHYECVLQPLTEKTRPAAVNSIRSDVHLTADIGVKQKNPCKTSVSSLKCKSLAC